jgi:glutathione S-transferase
MAMPGYARGYECRLGHGLEMAGSAMQLVLYELGGREGQRYSQFSWRSTLALAHKKLPFRSVQVRVSDKASIAFSGQTKVPILLLDSTAICDSWRIAEHLEDAFADRASLFGGTVGRGLARFVNGWVDRLLIPSLVPLLMIDVLRIVDEEDARHLRRQIETAFKATVEELAAQRETKIEAFRRSLDPARKTLQSQPYLSGPTPAYADYILFSVFQWARVVSPFSVLKTTDAIATWRDRMLTLHDGLALAEPAASTHT